MNNDDSDDPSVSSPRSMARRMRADSIPEYSEVATGAASTANASIEDLLMRHSSPLFNRMTGEAVTSPLAERHSSPSPLRLIRPRSNPRSRTPMRVLEHEEEQEETTSSTRESRRITIRLASGSGVEKNTTSYASRRIRQEQPTRIRSNKQGPSHRKARRWNNDNFVNLAAELSTGKGSASAVEALLKGSAEASKHRSIFDHKQHESKAMKKFREDDSLGSVREQFREGLLPCNIHTSSSSSKRKVVVDSNALTPLERFHRIESRLRRIMVKACENSYAASKVVNILEEFLIRVYNGEKYERSTKEWQEFLLDSPIVTAPKCSMNKGKNGEQRNQETEVTDSANISRSRQTIKFLFDADSATGGFHRLLLHGICQFHCIRAASSTAQINEKKARVLTATGAFSGSDVRLVDFITERQKNASNSIDTGVSLRSSPGDALSNKLSALKV